MASVEQLAVLLFAYVLLYVLVSYFLYWRRWGSEEADTTAAPTPPTRALTSADRGPEDAGEPSTVLCHQCRIENGAEYTYCRNCITELDGLGGRSPGV